MADSLTFSVYCTACLKHYEGTVPGKRKKRKKKECKNRPDRRFDANGRKGGNG
jgi:hypothetical protein